MKSVQLGHSKIKKMEDVFILRHLKMKKMDRKIGTKGVIIAIFDEVGNTLIFSSIFCDSGAVSLGLISLPSKYVVQIPLPYHYENNK